MQADETKLIEENIQKWIQTCTPMLKKSYCKYSRFPVACVLITDKDAVFTGCNVENSSYGLSICAERTAAVKAVSQGHRKFKACVVMTECPSFVQPCGACRQFLSEFGINMIVVCALKDGRYEARRLSELLPASFSGDDIKASHEFATAATTTAVDKAAQRKAAGKRRKRERRRRHTRGGGDSSGASVAATDAAIESMPANEADKQTAPAPQ